MKLKETNIIANHAKHGRNLKVHFACLLFAYLACFAAAPALALPLRF
jgi:hypothetical protein